MYCGLSLDGHSGHSGHSGHHLPNINSRIYWIKSLKSFWKFASDTVTAANATAAVAVIADAAVNSSLWSTSYTILTNGAPTSVMIFPNNPGDPSEILVAPVA